MTTKTIKTNKTHYIIDEIDSGDITRDEKGKFINAYIRKPFIENIEDVEQVEALIIEIKQAIIREM